MVKLRLALLHVSHVNNALPAVDHEVEERDHPRTAEHLNALRQLTLGRHYCTFMGSL